MMGVVRTLHAWAGTGLAALAIVLGLSGALLVFEDPWIRATVPAARAQAALDPDGLGAVLERLEAAEPGLTSVVLADSGVGVHRLRMKDHGFAYADTGGTVVARWRGNARAETLVFDLHHRLLAGDTGELVAGSAGLALAVMILTGLIAWIPAWRATGWRVWPRSGARRELVGSHRNLGLIFAVPLLVVCLTGAGMVFGGVAKAVLGASPAPPSPPPPPVGQGDIDWTRALAAARARFPGATVRMAVWPSEPGKPASIRMRQPGEWHPNGRTTVALDPATGRIVAAVDANAQDRGTRTYNAFYPLHSASVGGWLYDLVTALTGLAMAALGAVGAWAFLARPGRKRPTPPPRTPV